MNFVLDIDDTLIQTEKTFCETCGSPNGWTPRIMHTVDIEKINQLYDDGHIIILHTSRNWDCYEITKKQLSIFKIKHHELIMGKPHGIYVDADSHKTIFDAVEGLK